MRTRSHAKLVAEHEDEGPVVAPPMPLAPPPLQRTRCGSLTICHNNAHHEQGGGRGMAKWMGCVSRARWREWVCWPRQHFDA